MESHTELLQSKLIYYSGVKLEQHCIGLHYKGYGISLRAHVTGSGRPSNWIVVVVVSPLSPEGLRVSHNIKHIK